MANPTRSQIEAFVALPKYKVEIWYPVTNSWIQIPASGVVDISGNIESSGNIDNGLSFGSSVEPSLSITCERLVVPTADKVLEDTYWLLQRMKVSYGFDTSDFVRQFVGPIQGRSVNKTTVDLDITSNFEYIRNTKFYSPLYYAKPIATKTTIASVEDPTSGSYQAGLINRILWQAGGRPYEQENVNYTESSAGFKFWYSCEQSLLTPDWSWVSGESLLDEVFTLVQACGGQLYQDHNGVIRYVEPFSFADISLYGPGNPIFTYGDNHFEDYAEKTTTYEQVGSIRCTVTPRLLQPIQVIYEDTTPRLLQPSETRTITIETQWPIYEWINMASANNNTATNFTTTNLLPVPVTLTIGTVNTYATRADITVTNPSSVSAVIIHGITIKGRPVSAMEEVITTYGSGQPERFVEDNPYIQSEFFAKRLIRMIYDFYASGRPIVTLSGAIYDTDRYVGEIIKINSDYNKEYQGSGVYFDNDEYYRIVGIRHDGTGTKMDIDCVVVTGLPTKDQLFIIGTSYTSETKKLSY